MLGKSDDASATEEEEVEEKGENSAVVKYNSAVKEKRKRTKRARKVRRFQRHRKLLFFKGRKLCSRKTLQLLSTTPHTPKSIEVTLTPSSAPGRGRQKGSRK